MAPQSPIDLINYQPMLAALIDANADAWVERLPTQLAASYQHKQHGKLAEWFELIRNLPITDTQQARLYTHVIRIGSTNSLNAANKQQLLASLKRLHPWRKGPYELFGIHIDSEWRSDWKWARLEKYITPLTNRLVLDVGCGNGYHCWRMLGAGARLVIGIDPCMINIMQFLAIRQLYGEAPVYVLPLGIEALPKSLAAFDSVFSMGVLYHRRSPIDHLMELKDCLRPGGELILETLVINGKKGDALVPEDRYAKMRNVWFIPSCDTLISWMKRCGFINIRLVDITKTSIEEQRSTPWMEFHSLAEFLMPGNPDLTIEGLPAPTRAILIANKN
jgi:tRNA (mo5U34)-methyltransferase